MTIDKQKLYHIFQLLDDYFEDLGWYPGSSKTEQLLGMILVQNTNFSNVATSLENLKGQLSVEAILALSPEELQEKIKPSGFYLQKSKTIHDIFSLVEDSGGFSALKNLASNQLRERLLAVKGIGQETADVILLYLADDKRFISDAYARRVFGRCLNREFTSYARLMAIADVYQESLSLEQLQNFHAMIDELGGHICKKKPLCSLCPLQEVCDFNKASNGGV